MQTEAPAANSLMLFDEHDCRFAEILQSVTDAPRLIAVGMAIGFQTRHAIQRFADGAHVHFAAMQLLALEA